MLFALRFRLRCLSVCALCVAYVSGFPNTRGGIDAYAFAATAPYIFNSIAPTGDSICLPMPGYEQDLILLTSDGVSSDKVRNVYASMLETIGVAPGENVTITFVLDSKSQYTPETLETVLYWEKKQLQDACPTSVGACDIVDLMLHNESFDETNASEQIERSHVLYMAGGNTYASLASVRMRQTFWDGIVKPRLHSRKMIYVSRSAGTIVAGRDSRIAVDALPPSGDWWDLKGDFAGLGLVNCILRPHYDESIPKKVSWVTEFRQTFMADGACPQCAIVRYYDGSAMYWNGTGSDAQYVLGEVGEAPKFEPLELLTGPLPGPAESHTSSTIMPGPASSDSSTLFRFFIGLIIAGIFGLIAAKQGFCWRCNAFWTRCLLPRSVRQMHESGTEMAPYEP